MHISWIVGNFLKFCLFSPLYRYGPKYQLEVLSHPIYGLHNPIYNQLAIYN